VSNGGGPFPDSSTAPHQVTNHSPGNAASAENAGIAGNGKTPNAERQTPTVVSCRNEPAELFNLLFIHPLRRSAVASQPVRLD
jgi:hypothetical protein